jgi:hypothetical protein
MTLLLFQTGLSACPARPSITRSRSRRARPSLLHSKSARPRHASGRELSVGLYLGGPTRGACLPHDEAPAVVAGERLWEAGLEERLERHVMSFAKAAAAISAAEDHALQVLAPSFPRDAWWMQVGIGLMDPLMAITRPEFHVFFTRRKRSSPPASSAGSRRSRIGRVSLGRSRRCAEWLPRGSPGRVQRWPTGGSPRQASRRPA